MSSKQTLDRITIRTSNVPELKNVASAVKVDWEKLGIRVDIELYEPGDLSQNVIRPRKYEALLYGMVIGRDQDLYAFGIRKNATIPVSISRCMRTRPSMRFLRTCAARPTKRCARLICRRLRIVSPPIIRPHSSTHQTSPMPCQRICAVWYSLRSSRLPTDSRPLLPGIASRTQCGSSSHRRAINYFVRVSLFIFTSPNKTNNI